MHRITFSELKNKEVINIADGTQLGCVCDLEIDIPSGRICSIILPSQESFFSSLSAKNNIRIPWNDIDRIGDDIILVNSCDIKCPVKKK